MRHAHAGLAALAFVAAATLAAPALPARAQDAEAAPAFDAASFARYMQPGNGRIEGKLALRAARGDTSPQAGATIECYPALPYATWSLAALAARMNRELAADDTASTFAATDGRLERYARITKTDASGNFHFWGLPRGRYVLRATLITAFPRVVRDPFRLAMRAVYETAAPASGGQLVYDYTRAWFATEPVYAGLRPPYPPAFHLVARHDRFDPRR